MKLSEELKWRGMINQTTYPDIAIFDGQPITFYLGVDPSADSMQVGNLAIVMLVRHLVSSGHHAILLVGGATGMIGDPDGKKQERDLLTLEQISHNKQAIAEQYRQVLGDLPFELVDNYDWFKEMNYLTFLREVGKHVPLRTMLGRDFVQSRLGEDGAGISYAEFSYSLIQGYDFLHLFQDKGATLQVCGADQWGNCIAGVDLIRRKTGGEANVFSIPLVINRATGVKFGKTEGGAVWLDANKTSPTAFYQFWINCDDEGIEDYLKIYSDLGKVEVDRIMESHRQNLGERQAQIALAQAVTRIVHGEDQTKLAEEITNFLTGKNSISDASDHAIEGIRQEIPAVRKRVGDSVVETMIETGLASSNTEARRLITHNGVAINGKKIIREVFEEADFINNRLLLKRGKKFRDSALVELAND